MTTESAALRGRRGAALRPREPRIIATKISRSIRLAHELDAQVVAAVGRSGGTYSGFVEAALRSVLPERAEGGGRHA